LFEFRKQLNQMHGQTMVVGRDVVKTCAQVLQNLGRYSDSTLEAMENNRPNLVLIACCQERFPVLLDFSPVIRLVQAFPQTQEHPGSGADVWGAVHLHKPSTSRALGLGQQSRDRIRRLTERPRRKREATCARGQPANHRDGF